MTISVVIKNDDSLDGGKTRAVQVQQGNGIPITINAQTEQSFHIHKNGGDLKVIEIPVEAKTE